MEKPSQWQNVGASAVGHSNIFDLMQSSSSEDLDQQELKRIISCLKRQSQNPDRLEQPEQEALDFIEMADGLRNPDRISEVNWVISGCPDGDFPNTIIHNEVEEFIAQYLIPNGPYFRIEESAEVRNNIKLSDSYHPTQLAFSLNNRIKVALEQQYLFLKSNPGQQEAIFDPKLQDLGVVQVKLNRNLSDSKIALTDGKEIDAYNFFQTILRKICDLTHALYQLEWEGDSNMQH